MVAYNNKKYKFSKIIFNIFCGFYNPDAQYILCSISRHARARTLLLFINHRRIQWTDGVEGVSDLFVLSYL